MVTKPVKPAITGSESGASLDRHWTQSIVGRADCANCGGERLGDFCAHCGQQFFETRLHFWELVQNLLSRVTDIERGLLFTVINMFTRPGGVCRDYVSGKQKPYINPLTYFFLGAALQVFAFWWVADELRSRMVAELNQHQLIRNEEANAKLEELLGQPMAEALMDSYVSAILQGYTYVGLFSFVVPFAIWLWLFHSSTGEKFQVGETAVFGLYSFGQILVLTAVFGLVTFHLGNNAHLLMASSVYALFPQFAHTGFFASSWTSRLLTLLATLLAWCTFVLGILIMFALSFFLRILWAAQMG